MASDLTIRKLEGTTTPTVKTRAESIVDSHRKVQDLYPNVYDPTVPDVSDLIGLPQFGEMVKNYAKGVSIATASMGPDLLGAGIDPLAFAGPAAGAVRRQLEGVGINVPQTARVINPATGEAFTGDTLRDAVGLDPESVAGLVGEMTGNWEAFAAKAPALASKVFGGMMQVDPNATLGMLVGARGIGRAGKQLDGVDSMEMAQNMLDSGVPEWEVFATTGWSKGSDGNLKFFVSDKDSVVNVDALREAGIEKITDNNIGAGEYTSVTRPIRELFDHPKLYEIYPELADTPLTVHLKRVEDRDGKVSFKILDPTTEARGSFYGPSAEYPQGRLSLNNPKPKDMDFGRRTVLHEIQHKVQSMEGWGSGASGTRLKDSASSAIFGRGMIAMNDAVANGLLTSKSTRSEINQFIFDQGFVSEAEATTKGGQEMMQSLRGAIEKRVSMDSEGLADLAFHDEMVYNDILDDLSKAFGNKQLTDDILDMMENDDALEVLDKAMQRYWNDGGEVEARITEFLRDKTEDEVRSLALVQERTIEDMAEVMPSKPVNPDDIVRTP